MNVVPFDSARDSLTELTQLVNAAYAPLAALGFNYVAATQDLGVTQRRVAAANRTWVARSACSIAGTISYYEGLRSEAGPAWYGCPGIAYFGLFAVDPALQGCGIGTALLDAAECRARDERREELSCDTAEGASRLVAFYSKRGFRAIGVHRWPHANYRSVILSKRLTL